MGRDESVGGIYSPHTPRKGSRHISRLSDCNICSFTLRDMAGAFFGGVGGIDTPRAPVSQASTNFSPDTPPATFFRVHERHG